MRYSTNEKDVGYLPWQRTLACGEKIVVYLNGVEVKEVITVDTLSGFILKAVEPVHVEDDTDKIATEELYGNVTIKFELKAK